MFPEVHDPWAHVKAQSPSFVKVGDLAKLSPRQLRDGGESQSIPTPLPQSLTPKRHPGGPEGPQQLSQHSVKWQMDRESTDNLEGISRLGSGVCILDCHVGQGSNDLGGRITK